MQPLDPMQLGAVPKHWSEPRHRLGAAGRPPAPRACSPGWCAGGWRRSAGLAQLRRPICCWAAPGGRKSAERTARMQAPGKALQ
jgi:hypothetical protein